MPDDVKIRVTAPGAQKADRDIRKVAKAEEDLGRKGKKAGKDVKKGTAEAGEGFDELGRSMGVNVGAFKSWKLAAVGAFVAVLATAKSVINRIQEVNRELAGFYQRYVDITQQPGTIQLAQIRGETEKKTALWMLAKQRQFGIPATSAREAAFTIESGLEAQAVGGVAARSEITDIALKTARATGATGRTVGDLAIAAFEAGQAKRPAEFRQFFAKAASYAAGSKVSLEELGGIAARLLPMAVSVGIDPDYFMAQAAAMSFRIPSPSRLATALEQLIRAAGTKGPALEAEAARTGRKVAEMSGREVMEMQSRLLAAAAKRGPQAIAAMAEQLGLAAEIGTVYVRAFDPKVQARMAGMRARAGAATYQEVIAGRFAGIMARPEARYQRARYGKQEQEMLRAVSGEAFEAEWMAHEEMIAAQMAAGEGGYEAWEAIGGLEGRKRALFARYTLALLRQIAATEEYAPEMRGAAGRQAEAIGEAGFGVGWQMFGLGRGRYVEAHRLIQESGIRFFEGGTHYHTGDKQNPAGRPRTPVGAY